MCICSQQLILTSKHVNYYEGDASASVGAEAGPLSPQALAARPPLARDSSQALPRVSSAERLQSSGTPGKLPQAKAQAVQLKPGHKVATPHPVL